MPFGGAPKCPTCDKSVYAAEQVMGPGRKIYHKPCLKCVSCARRLDSLSLLEHNQEPYCKSCHVKNFGTRDLRSANLSPSTPPTTPPRVPKPSPGPDSAPPSSSLRQQLSEDEFVTTTSNEVAQEMDPIARTSSPPTLEMDFPPDGDGAANGNGARPLTPTATGSSTASAPVYLRQNDTPTRQLKQSYTGDAGAGSNSPRKTFSIGSGAGGTPNCPRCGKVVYFAEQVKASGRTWHKPCLRCTECSVLLDSTRLTEKDGVVMCRSCYSKLHGPQGSGYGLLGRG